MPKSLLLLLPALLFTGCAALTASKTETLYVSSVPAGAEIRVNGGTLGRTPGSVAIDRAMPPRVEVGFPGQPGSTCPVLMSPGAGYVVSDVLLCLFLFPIGCVSFIDAGGAWNQLQTPNCNVNLPAPQGYPGYENQQYPQQNYPPQQQQYPQQQQGYPPPPPQGYPPPPPSSYPPPPPGR